MFKKSEIDPEDKKAYKEEMRVFLRTIDPEKLRKGNYAVKQIKGAKELDRMASMLRERNKKWFMFLTILTITIVFMNVTGIKRTDPIMLIIGSVLLIIELITSMFLYYASFTKKTQFCRSYLSAREKMEASALAITVLMLLLIGYMLSVLTGAQVELPSKIKFNIGLLTVENIKWFLTAFIDKILFLAQFVMYVYSTTYPFKGIVKACSNYMHEIYKGMTALGNKGDPSEDCYVLDDGEAIVCEIPEHD